MIQQSETTYPISAFVFWRTGCNDSAAMIREAQRLTDEILKKIQEQCIPHCITSKDLEKWA